MFKRICLLSAIAVGVAAAGAAEADAGVFVRRVAPVRRVVARAVVPRRAVYRPVYRPVARPYYGYGARPYYGRGVSVRVGGWGW